MLSQPSVPGFPRKKMKPWKIAALVFLALMVIGSLSNNDDQASKKNPPKKITTSVKQTPKKPAAKKPVDYSSPTIGDIAYVRMNNIPRAWLASTPDDFKQFNKAAAADDDIGFAELISQGKVFPVAKNTKVKVIDISVIKFAYQVRVLEGEKYGSAGWISTEFVHKQKT
jgi:hypothetical protein